MVDVVYEKYVEVDCKSCSLYERMPVSHHPGCLVSRLETEVNIAHLSNMHWIVSPMSWAKCNVLDLGRITSISTIKSSLSISLLFTSTHYHEAR